MRKRRLLSSFRSGRQGKFRKKRKFSGRIEVVGVIVLKNEEERQREN